MFLFFFLLFPQGFSLNAQEPDVYLNIRNIRVEAGSGEKYMLFVEYEYGQTKCSATLIRRTMYFSRPEGKFTNEMFRKNLKNFLLKTSEKFEGKNVNKKTFLERNFIHVVGIGTIAGFFLADWDNRHNWKFVPIRQVSDLWQGSDKIKHDVGGGGLTLFNDYAGYYAGGIKEAFDVTFRGTSFSWPDVGATCATSALVHVGKIIYRHKRQGAKKRYSVTIFNSTTEVHFVLKW